MKPPRLGSSCIWYLLERRIHFVNCRQAPLFLPVNSGDAILEGDGQEEWRLHKSNAVLAPQTIYAPSANN